MCYGFLNKTKTNMDFGSLKAERWSRTDPDRSRSLDRQSPEQVSPLMSSSAAGINQMWCSGLLEVSGRTERRLVVSADE